MFPLPIFITGMFFFFLLTSFVFINKISGPSLVPVWSQFGPEPRISAACQTAVLHQYFHRCFRTGMRLNASVISLVYGKSLRIASAGGRNGSFKKGGWEVGKKNMLAVGSFLFLLRRLLAFRVFGGPGVSLFHVWRWIWGGWGGATDHGGDREFDGGGFAAFARCHDLHAHLVEWTLSNHHHFDLFALGGGMVHGGRGHGDGLADSFGHRGGSIYPPGTEETDVHQGSTDQGKAAFSHLFGVTLSTFLKKTTSFSEIVWKKLRSVESKFLFFCYFCPLVLFSIFCGCFFDVIAIS